MYVLNVSLDVLIVNLRICPHAYLAFLELIQIQTELVFFALPDVAHVHQQLYVQHAEKDINS
jgi:hypothetical protein